MKLVARLLKLLEQNAELYEQMAQKTRDERVTIEAGSLEELAEIVKAKETIALKIKMLDEARLKLIEKIGDVIERPSAEITLDDLAEMPENIGIRSNILSLRRRLTDVASLTKELNDFNRALISRAVGTIRESFNFANNLLDPSSTYSPGRGVQNNIKVGRMITRSY